MGRYSAALTNSSTPGFSYTFVATFGQKRPPGPAVQPGAEFHKPYICLQPNTRHGSRQPLPFASCIRFTSSIQDAITRIWLVSHLPRVLWSLDSTIAFQVLHSHHLWRSFVSTCIVQPGNGVEDCILLC